MDASIIKNIFLSLAGYYSAYEYRRFSRSLSKVEDVQRNKLSTLLGQAENTEYGRQYGLTAMTTWEDLKKKVPIVDYKDVAGLISRQKMLGTSVISGSECKYYQPTAGMNEFIKWIPFTELYISELEAATSQILVQFMKKNRNIFKGRQFWSVPWYPPRILEEMGSSARDNRGSSFLKNRIKSQFMIVPEEVSFIGEYEDYCLANLSYLAACDDLSLISVWDPAFFLNLIDRLSVHKEELAEILWNGSWGKKAKVFSGLACPVSRRASKILARWDGRLAHDFTRSLWPGLCMISSWDTGSSKTWIKELLKLFPDTPFQGKGLWTTEGVVTIPCEGKYPLAVTSHFYEFQDIETSEIYPSWELRKGQLVSPIISTGSGLLRYILRDRIEVTGFLEQCPCFHYHGRSARMDIAGENMNTSLAQKVLDEVSARFGINTVSFFAVPQEYNDGGRPYYMMLCGRNQEIFDVRQIASCAEELLMHHLHYRLARDLDQLAPLRVLAHPNARQLYQKLAIDSGTAAGNMKIEPLVLLKNRGFSLDEEGLYTTV